MQYVENILAIPDDDGYLIGKPVQAYLNKHDLKVHGFLFQLLGLPARLVYCNISHNLASIDENSIHLTASCRPTLISLDEELELVEDLDLISLSNLPVRCQKTGFIGFLKDFDISPQTLFLSEIKTVDEEWTLTGDIQLGLEQNIPILEVDDVHHNFENSNPFFFEKKVIQDIYQFSTDEYFPVGAYSEYGVRHV